MRRSEEVDSNARTCNHSPIDVQEVRGAEYRLEVAQKTYSESQFNSPLKALEFLYI